jgi:hypothetical protein
MPLKRVTKSIPLAGGEQNEAPDFLLEPPGMAHIENGRYTKEDTVEKVEPVGFEGFSGVGNHTGQVPFVLSEVNNTLVTVGKDKVAKFDGTSWTAKDHQGDPLGLERVLSTATQAGGNNFTWCPIGDWNTVASPDEIDINGYAVAFEKRDNSSATPVVSVYLHRYDVRGNLVDETLIGSNFISPKLVNLHGNNAKLFVGVTDNTIRRATVFPPTNATPHGTVTTVSGVSFVSDERQGFNATGTWDALNVEEMRSGFAYNSDLHCNFQVKFHPQLSTAGIGVLAWKEEGVGTIRWTLLDQFGDPTGTTYDLGLTAENPPTFMHEFLDVDVDATDVVFLRTENDTTNVLGDVLVLASSVSHTNTGLATAVVAGSEGATVPQGTIALKSDGSVTIVYQRVFGSPTLRMGSDFSNTDGLRFLTSNIPASATLQFQLNGFKLASNIVYDKDNNANIVVQQWSNTTPNNGGQDPETRSLNPASIKPVTSTLVKLVVGSPSTLHVVGTMDAGQSRSLDASFDEQNIQFGDLFYLDEIVKQDESPDRWRHSFWFGNRNILGLEDLYIYLSTDLASPDNVAHGNSSLLSGDARMNLYRIAPDVEINSVDHGEGFILNTALPLWYDGAGLGEISVIDQPEIISVTEISETGSSQDIESFAYNQVQADYKIIQAVSAYTDASGNVHRSAPSFPLFVGGLDPDASNAIIEVRVAATPAISFLGGDREYTMEFYVAGPGEVPQLAASATYFPNQTATSVAATFFANLNPTDVGLNTEEPVRQSKFIYTAGNVLPVDPWPSVKEVVTTSRRMFGTSEAAPGTIFYSKIFEENVSPEFSASLVLALGESRKLTALGRVDDKVIAFERDAIHVINGTGPDNTGANGDFFVTRLSTTVGCEDPESVLTADEGLAFFSSVTQEFHLITRDLQIVDIGGPVQDLTSNPDFNILSSLEYRKEHELRWYVTNLGSSSEFLPAGDTGPGIPPQPPRPRVGRSVSGTGSWLSFNTRYSKWCAGSGPAIGYASAIYNNRPALLDDIFDLYLTSDDLSKSEFMTWETPWIKVNQLQDYGRFYTATFLGKYLSSWTDNGSGVEAGDLKVTVKYDYEGLNGVQDVYLFRANVDFDPAGSERLQLAVHPGRQKCQAIKFLIEEQATSGQLPGEPTYTKGRGFELNSLDLLFGAKVGSSKSIGQRRSK